MAKMPIQISDGGWKLDQIGSLCRKYNDNLWGISIPDLRGAVEGTTTYTLPVLVRETLVTSGQNQEELVEEHHELQNTLQVKTPASPLIPIYLESVNMLKGLTE